MWSELRALLRYSTERPGHGSTTVPVGRRPLWTRCRPLVVVGDVPRINLSGGPEVADGRQRGVGCEGVERFLTDLLIEEKKGYWDSVR